MGAEFIAFDFPDQLKIESYFDFGGNKFKRSRAKN
jgi:hypothetical protein